MYIMLNETTNNAFLHDTNSVYGWKQTHAFVGTDWCKILGNDTTSWFTEKLSDLITEEINDFQGEYDLDEEISDESNEAIAVAIEQLQAAIALAKLSTYQRGNNEDTEHH